MRRRRGVRAMFGDEAGSFALESAVVFPAVMFAVLAVLFTGLLVYERAMLYYSASSAAERAAFRWDNSHRDAVTGIAPVGQYDGLYWRLSDDRLLQSLFGFSGEADRSAAVAIPSRNDGEAGGLPEAKLRSAAGRIDGRYAGEAAYARHPLMKEVKVRLEAPFAYEVMPKLTGGGAIRAAAAAPVNDAVELIRTVDLARYYAAKFGSGQAAAGKRAQAGTAVRDKAGQAGGGGTA